MADTARFDRDPDALAWARAKVASAASRYEAFAERAAADGNHEAAVLWGKTASAIRRDLIGRGHVIGEFDERLPQMLAGKEVPRG